MPIKYINFLIVLISLFSLTGCGEILNRYLDGEFPLNTKNDGHKITVYSDITPETMVSITGVYTSDKCERSHFNAAYTNVSYSPLKNEIDIESTISNDNQTSTSILSINGGGWCNWELTKIKIIVAPEINESSVTTPIFIPITNTNKTKVKYFLTMASIKNKKEKKEPIINYSLSIIEDKSISNKKNGEIYFKYKIDPDLETTISSDKKAVFPNGNIKDLGRSTYSDFIEFDEIIQNSNKKDFTSFSEYMD